WTQIDLGGVSNCWSIAWVGSQRWLAACYGHVYLSTDNGASFNPSMSGIDADAGRMTLAAAPSDSANPAGPYVYLLAGKFRGGGRHLAGDHRLAAREPALHQVLEIAVRARRLAHHGDQLFAQTAALVLRRDAQFPGHHRAAGHALLFRRHRWRALPLERRGHQGPRQRQRGREHHAAFRVAPGPRPCRAARL